MATLLCALAVTLLMLETTATPLTSQSLPEPTCQGVQVAPGTNLQARIDANPPRTTFCFAQGLYRLSGTIWTGDKFPTLDLRAGAVIDGQNGGFFGINGVETPADRPGTVILGGVFQHFGNANAPGYIQPVIVHRNAVVDGTEFRENFNAGLGIYGDNARVSNIYTHHNGQYGLAVTHSCVGCPAPKGVIIEDSEIAFNNTRRLDPGHDAGGTKFTAGTDRMIVRGNEVHDNYGAGLWWDGFNKNVQVYGNAIYNNRNWGIFYEISYGGTKIHHNTLTNNAAGLPASWIMAVQLLVASSDGSVGGSGGIEIYENTINGAAYPLGVITHSGRPITKGVYVHDNVMTLRVASTRVGGIDSSGTGQMFAASSGNRFEANTYRVLDLRGAYWAWGGQTLTWSQWQALGHDVKGARRLAT